MKKINTKSKGLNYNNISILTEKIKDFIEDKFYCWYKHRNKQDLNYFLIFFLTRKLNIIHLKNKNKKGLTTEDLFTDKNHCFVSIVLTVWIERM